MPDYAKPDAASALLGIGTTLRIGTQTSLYINADGHTGANAREGTISIGGRYTF